MAAGQKFLFENDFAHPDEARKRAAVHTDEDLAAARAQSFAEGRAAMLAEQEAADEQEIFKLLTQLGDNVQGLCAERGAEIDNATAQAGELALTICRKILPTLSNQNAMTEIEGLIVRTIAEMQDEPRLVVRVADARVEDLQSRFERMAGAFEGSLVLLGDDELADTDCSLLWADGGAERNLDRLWAELNTAVSAISDTRTQPTPASPLEDLEGLTAHPDDLPDALVAAAVQTPTNVENDTAKQESGHG
jgi:flagellar assembly protein FliH